MSNFDNNGFWATVRRTAGKVPFVNDALAMYFAMLDDETPLPAKATIAAALAYFVLPADVIPDVLPVIGYTDDAATIAGALGLVATHVTREHKRLARKALSL